MVKEFLKCNSIRERIQFLANTVLKDWDASELDTVMDIMGLSKEGMEAPEDKISAIEKYLADYKHEVEMRGGIDGSRVDGIPAKDQGSTLFEGPSEAEVVNKMLNPFQGAVSPSEICQSDTQVENQVKNPRKILLARRTADFLLRLCG